MGRAPCFPQARQWIIQLCHTPSEFEKLNMFYPRNIQSVLSEDNMNKCSAVAKMGDGLATIDMGRKVKGEGGCCAPFGGGELGTHLTQCGLRRDLPPYQVAS